MVLIMEHYTQFFQEMGLEVVKRHWQRDAIDVCLTFTFVCNVSEYMLTCEASRDAERIKYQLCYLVRSSEPNGISGWLNVHWPFEGERSFHNFEGLTCNLSEKRSNKTIFNLREVIFFLKNICYNK